MTYGVVFAGNSLANFDVVGSMFMDTTNTSRWDTSMTSGCMSLFNGDSTSYLQTKHFQDPATGANVTLSGNFGFRMCWSINTGFNSTTNTQWQVLNDSGVPVMRIVGLIVGANPTQNYKLQYWNGSAWVDSGATFSMNSGERWYFDIIGTCGNPGSVSIMKNDTLISSGSIGSQVTNLAYAQYYGNSQSTGGNAWASGYSQVIIKDGSTVLHNLRERKPNANGNYQTWTNSSYTNVIDYSDTTYAADNFNGDRVSWKLGQMITTPSASQQVLAVVIGARNLYTGSGVRHQKAFLRETSVDYDGPQLTPSAGWSGSLTIWQVDPATGLPYTIAAANDVLLEAGVEALN